MTVGLDAFGCLDKACDFILGKAGFLDVAEQIHDLGLVMKIADNFWVRGRGQAEKHVRVGRHNLGQLLDYLRPRRALLAGLRGWHEWIKHIDRIGIVKCLEDAGDTLAKSSEARNS